jgi:glycine/D-amino acid oxidase-like deaminating enzyme
MQSSNTDNGWDVVVIGAGVFGAWTAYRLRQSGKRVLLIDAYGAGNDRSSSGDRSRIIRMGYGADEIYTRWARRALGLWEEFFALVNEPLFHRTGVLWLAHQDDPYPVRCAATLGKVGIAFEQLTIEDLSERYPQFVTNDLAWAMFEPQGGALIASRAVQAVVREAVKGGVLYRQDLVRPIDPDVEGQLEFMITESGERLSAGSYVFACGPWLPKIFPELLGDRIHPSRQEVFYFDTGVDRRAFSIEALPIWIDFKDAVTFRILKTVAQK